MAATPFRAAAAPLQTAAPTVIIPPFRGLGRRFDNSTITTRPSKSQGPNCSNFNGFQTCSSGGDYGSCLANNDTDYCNCNNGVQYLDCVSAALATSSCQGAVAGVGDWEAYERNWIQDSCPSTPPAAVMTELPQPSTVELDFEPVSTVTPSGPITKAPPPLVAPSFSDGGELLTADCKSTSYTLVDGGDMVYYVAFIGCNADRPQCCPWDVSIETLPSESDGKGNRVAAEPGQFPIPADAAKGNLARCPRDYYSVSGQCCPNGYYKFTRRVAYQTPCFSSLAEKATPPAITAGLAANPTDSSLPTSAVVNVAWAMGYNTTGDPSPPLSQGATIGIGVGAGILGISLGVLAAFFIMRWRRNKKSAVAAERLQQTVQLEPHQGMTYHHGYHAPLGSPPLPSSNLGPPAPTKYAHTVSTNSGGDGVGGDWNGGYGYPHPSYPHQPQQMAGYEGYSHRT
ncbi:hypothetical protein MFIFM68171_10095 [Madurella fahalii]|uniref:Uncharacterized protein n=1 Tax=Madurella fahalii TaxID=1157608 RepID=A0ABQ0GQ83_9PEZI